MNVREIIVERLERLREYVSYLKEYRKHSLEEISKDPTLRGAIERYLQLSAEVVIDISEILISDLGLRKPETYREAIYLRKLPECSELCSVMIGT